MSSLGFLVSLGDTEISNLNAFFSDENRPIILQVTFDEAYLEQYPGRAFKLDTLWDPLHRSLTDGKLEFENGIFPLSHVILGGELLHSKDNYIMTLKTPEQVREIAHSIATLPKEVLRNGYNQIDPGNYRQPLTEEDFDNTWNRFKESHHFWKKAAEEKRHVLFTVEDRDPARP